MISLIKKIIYSVFQEAIFDFIVNETGNLVVSAVAGSGKTSTIVEALNRLPSDKRIILLAFNKHIAEELKKRVPSNVHVYTTHALGWAAIRRKFPKAIIEPKKAIKVLYKKYKSWDLTTLKINQDDYLKNILKMVDLVRLNLTFDTPNIIKLAEKHDIKKFSTTDVNRVMSILEVMHNDTTCFDYVDMVYQICIRKELFLFPYDIIFVDECQDLNKAQHKILNILLNKKKGARFIAVGDKYQSLYGFLGSDTNSFNKLLNFPNTKNLPLSVCYRCGKNIVKLAQKIVPEIQYYDDAIDGVVREGNVLEEAKTGDWVLCRTTKPLVKLFLEFLQLGKKVTIKGQDFGVSLIEMIKPYESKSNISLMINDFNDKLTVFEQDLLNNGITNFNDSLSYVNLKDKIDIIKLLSENLKDITAIIDKISNIFKDTNDGIILSTVHKSKGLEANRVFVIRTDKLPLKVSQAWMYEQEQNLIYVCYTRAKEELIFDRVWTDEI